MSVTLRAPSPADAPELGRICHDAFKAIAEAHGFTPDFPSVQVAQDLISSLINSASTFGVVAVDDGRPIGSNFLDERGPIAGLGPITVDPTDQNTGTGALLMRAAMDRCAARPGVRLVQSGYHSRSLALYLRLGFEVREHLACLQGPSADGPPPGFDIRPARVDDLGPCDALCRRVHGHDRSGELADAIEAGVARVVERAGRITGYASQIAFFGHAVAETNDDLAALIADAPAIAGPGMLVPTRNGELMRWCLARGLRVTQAMTLMSFGLYNAPAGAWLPSVLY